MENRQSAHQPMLGFSSDNTAAASAEIMQALVACNVDQAAPYGGDAVSLGVRQQLCELFEHDLDVFLVATGTAANALALSALSPPWGSVFCHPGSHINNDECGAPEFFTHGAKLVSVDGPATKMDVAQLASAIQCKVGDVHATQPACVSLTQATEAGSIYSLAELNAIGDLCRSASLGLHMDGSRFANALVALGCTPAEMSWKAGVQALSLGATKNGALGVDAVLLFDRTLSQQLAFRRKRAGHLSSKMRFLSAQMAAYLHQDLWLNNARQANDMAQRLVAGLQTITGVEVAAGSQTNIIFCRLPADVINGLLAAGFVFYHGRWGDGVVRFVTSFATRPLDVDHLLTHIRQLAARSGAVAAPQDTGARHD
jgi:threonine aldolase